MEIALMPKHVINDVQTKPVGFAPILAHYFEKCNIVDIVDGHVPTDPRRKVLTHGQACIAMITGILFQAMQLYRICQFAKESTVLNVLLPGIAQKEYFDDRLADTLDSLYDFGLGNLETMITSTIIKAFNIKTDICHNDTTCAFVYGDCNKNRSDQGIKITYGYSKQYRNDLKQLVWSLSVSSDSAFPLFQKAYSGNTADVDTYVEQWHHLIDLLGKRNFLFVGDSKVASKENMAHIHDHEGFFISPLPMYASYERAFTDALDRHDREVLIPYKDLINRGFEVPLMINHEDKDYLFRMIILFDHGLFHRKRKSLIQRIEKTQAAFVELSSKLNSYQLKSEAAIDKACQAILKKYKSQDFFEYILHNDPLVTYKNSKPGRPSAIIPVEKIPVAQNRFRVDLHFDESAYDRAISRIGYYPLITNMPKSQLSITDAMMAHKHQYKVEHTYRRSKSGYRLEPIYLHTPERIEAYLFLFKIALQVVVLIERTARKNIRTRDKGLDNFMPNRKDHRTPKAEYLLQKFEYVVSGNMRLTDGNDYGFVSELTELQSDILKILDVPDHCYSYAYLFDSS
jgi:transposase